MDEPDHKRKPEAPPAGNGGIGIQQLIRLLPIRWRIFSIAILNTLVVAVLAAVIWNGAQILDEAWRDLRQVRQSDRLLVTLESESAHLQGLIHRYFTQPDPVLFGQIMLQREALMATLQSKAAADPLLAGAARELIDLTERFIVGFGDLRETRAAISRTYESEIATPAREMTGLFALLEGAIGRDALMWPMLRRSREAFAAAVVSANAYYLSLSAAAGAAAGKGLAALEQAVGLMPDRAETDIQRSTLEALAARIAAMKRGLAELTAQLATQVRLLRDEIDANQAQMFALTSRLAGEVRSRELRAQERFDQTLRDVYLKAGIVALAVLLATVIIGTGIARSISRPLSGLMRAMHAIVSGDYGRRTVGLKARDEIGEMARAVEVFRENAVAKRRAEEELRSAKERAETALTELTQRSRELTAANDRLAAQWSRLRRANAFKSEVLGKVAHDLKNPLGVILGRAEMLSDLVHDPPVEAEQALAQVDHIRQSTRQLVGMVDALVSDAMADALDISIRREPTDIAALIEEIAEANRPLADRKRQTIAVDAAVPLVASADQDRLREAIDNLVSNAIKYSPPGGRIALATGMEADDIVIRVRDSGPGFSPEDMSRLFGRFQRLSAKPTGGETSTGLGLSIAKRIVDLHGGRIAAESAGPDGGTTFTISLPASPKA